MTRLNNLYFKGSKNVQNITPLSIEKKKKKFPFNLLATMDYELGQSLLMVDPTFAKIIIISYLM